MRKLVLVLPCLLLVGCGGGGGSTSSAPSNTIPIPAGIYWGTDVVHGLASAYPLIGGLAPSGKFVLAEFDSSYLMGSFAGTLVPGTTNFTGTGFEYLAPADAGAPVAFTFGPGLPGNLPWVAGSLSGQMGLGSDPVYNEPPSTASMAGAYQSTQNNIGVPLQITLAADGTFTGSDQYSTFSGSLTQITAGANLYNVTLTMASPQTTFTGMAFWSGSSPSFQPNCWYLAVNCSTYGIVAIIPKS